MIRIITPDQFLHLWYVDETEYPDYDEDNPDLLERLPDVLVIANKGQTIRNKWDSVIEGVILEDVQDFESRVYDYINKRLRELGYV